MKKRKDNLLVEEKYMYFEDYIVGTEYELPDVVLSREEIIEFAEKYDPRPFHIDEQEAKKTMFGDIIASEYHSFLAISANWVRTRIDEEGLICGMNIVSCSWLKPVYPDQRLKCKAILSGKKDTGKPTASHGFYTLVGSNEDGEKVVEIEVKVLLKKRGY